MRQLILGRHSHVRLPPAVAVTAGIKRAITTTSTATTTTAPRNTFDRGEDCYSPSSQPSNSQKQPPRQQENQHHHHHHHDNKLDNTCLRLLDEKTNHHPLASRDWLEVRPTRTGGGRGVFALRDFAVGDKIMSTHVLDTQMSTQADRHTIQLNPHGHAPMDPPARFLSHCCHEANVGVILTTTTTTTMLRPRLVNDNDGVVVGEEEKEETTNRMMKGSQEQVQDHKQTYYTIDFYAIRPIPNQQELCFDYETTEFELASPFDCSCGSLHCRGRLTGFRHHGPQVMAAYPEQFVAPYLVEWYRNNKSQKERYSSKGDKDDVNHGRLR